MVRVHCSKDTLDAHARSDVVNGGKRKRKEASGQVDQGLIEFLIGSHMASGESKRELADREEAITGINPLSHPDRQLETVADLLPDGHEDVQCDSD